MKLLIVDDEKLTREGIRDSLNLESLGISQVLLEDDGIHGLKTALEEKPDIVLKMCIRDRFSFIYCVTWDSLSKWRFCCTWTLSICSILNSVTIR